MRLGSMLIKSNLKDYTAYFENNPDFIHRLNQLPNSIFVIDSNIWNIYKDSLLACISPDKVIILPISEERKTLDTVQELYNQIMEYSPKKNLCLIAVGGGILQDIAGFTASTLYRGINWIFVPTTLLAQTDSCIGAKTSLNYKKFKNLVGTFYPPSEIYIYPQFLKTQEKQDFYSGIGEMAKFHLMGGREDTLNFIKSIPKIDSFNLKTLEESIQKGLLIKQSYIEDDEFDTDKRNMLNYGHCFGHAIESSTNFGIPHGQAVVLGMITANITAKEKGLLSAENEKFIREKILLLIFKTDIKNINLNTEDTIEAMAHDKKNTGEGLALVMINDNYEMIKINNLSKIEAINSFKKMKEIMEEELSLL